MLTPQEWREVPRPETITLPDRVQAASYVMQAGWDLTDRAKDIGNPNVKRAEVEQLAQDIDGVAAMLRRFATRLPASQIIDVEAHRR